MTEENLETPEEEVEETPTEEETPEVVEEVEEEVVEEETPEPDTSKDDEIAKLKRMLKQSKKKQKAPAQSKKPELSRDEIILLAKGTNEELLDTAKMVSETKGITLGEALKDPIVEAVKAQQILKAKSEKAALGGSKKGTQSANPSYVPNQKKEDHRKVWEEAQKG